MPDPALLREFVASPDRMPSLLHRFRADRESLESLFAVPHSQLRLRRLNAFFQDWRELLEQLSFDELTHSDKADWILLRNLLESELHRLHREGERFAEMEPLIPFYKEISALEDSRRLMESISPEAIAETLNSATKRLAETRIHWHTQHAVGVKAPCLRPVVAFRASKALEQLRNALEQWFGFHFGYHPLFTWWVETPYRALDTALKEYAGYLREEIAGAKERDAILGDPIGREALLEELALSLVPYTPEELLEIGRREWDWCIAELCRAAQKMGLGDDWRAAIEQVKTRHVPPGEQPALVRELAEEALAYVEERELVTVPDHVREHWRMEMMTPEQQKVNPFFLGGETIIVSYPTHTMTHTQKQMSLRGNNPHFSRATVQHELIPGHYLQLFSMERYRPYRQIFETPFWIEGWTLHWEMLLWDLGFAESPEDRVGMLFWRLHRCGRVLFSLGFHLGTMTPEECITLLVDEVGHERENAIAEVRRSFGGDYDPLYQCAYLLGGLQVRALHRELVGVSGWTQREFHDAFLRENTLPIPMLRALLKQSPLSKEFPNDWRFYDGLKD